jgi:hypothetical protein
MQQRFRRFALFFGATALAGGGLIMVACGTDNGTTPTPSLEASTPKDGSGNNSETSTTNPDGGGIADAAAEADCTKDPKLRDYTAGFRCAFSDAGGRDSGSNCTNVETCCNSEDKVGTAFQPSFCAVGKNGDTTCKAGAAGANSSFDAGNAWECADKNACNAGQICCMVVDQAQAAAGKSLNIGNTLASDKNHPPACGVKRAFNEGGSRCRTPAMPGACPAGEIKLCSLSDQNCGGGTTCTPFVDFQQTHRGTCL